MIPERVDFWGIPSTWGSPAIYVYTLMFLAAAILLWRLYLKARSWVQIGRPASRWNRFFIRLGNLIKYAIVQIKVLSQRYPGVMHVSIAWSFFIFLLGTALATIDSHFYKILVGTPYLLHKLVMDLFIIVFFFGAGLAIYRRYIQKPARLTLTENFTWSLILLILIVLGGLLTESLRLAVERPAWAWWSPMGWLVAKLWIATGASDSTLMDWHLGIWTSHLLIVAATIITLPVGTLLHVLSGPLNIFFADPKRTPGQLQAPAENEKGESIFAGSLQQLSWFQLLSSEGCTECGRCQEVCPAFAAGNPLNPKKVILGVRDALIAARMKKNEDHRKLVGEWIEDAALWSCTSCMACIQECPVLINHLDFIVDMRRFLVIEGRMGNELQAALENFGRYGNSFGQSDRMRAKWTQTVLPKVKDARREPVEYLWFVGDYASYSPTLLENTIKTAEVFNKMGLDFGILYEAERNSGNDIRRIGEEGLFELLREKNCSTIEKSNFKTIVTTDPHSYNTLKNEYPANNGHQILHYSQLLDQMLASGRIVFPRKLNLTVTYHDPCYLGRYNQIYEAPRKVIQATGCHLVEMPRHAERAFCCGAGGGRIWMPEGEIKERPSEMRIKEAVSLQGVTDFIVTCPKDVTMFRDAVKTTGNENNLQVKDLIELVSAAL